MQIWYAELKELEKLHNNIKGQFPDLDKELEHLIRTEDANVVLLYSRRCLEVIITDLCESELKRPRKTDPLKGIIDKLHREDKVPPHIITSMDHLNSLSNYGAHPKDFEIEQVKPVLNNLTTIIRWYQKYKENITSILAVDAGEGIQHTDRSKQIFKKVQHTEKKKTVSLGWLISICIVVVLFVTGYFIIPGLLRPKEPDEKSIAVLPLANLSNDDDQAWLSGITDVIINQLSKITEFRVLPRTSTLKYKENDGKKSASEIGKELGVDFILDGSVQKQENQIRITIQLIRVREEVLLWSEVYDKKWGEIFNIQSDIAKSVASNLQIKLSPEETRQIENIGTDNAEAYRQYLLGYSYMLNPVNAESGDVYQKAVYHYRQAIELDSNFARAYAGLASSYLELAGWMVSSPSAEYIPLAREYALNALKIDGSLGEAYFMLGKLYYLFEWNWNEAEKAFRKAMELDPDFVYGRIEYANFLSAMGRFEESISISRQTMVLDPVNPLVYNELAYALALNGQYQEAIDLVNKSFELDPDFCRWLLDYTYELKKDYRLIVSEWEKIKKLFNNDLSKISAYELLIAGRVLAKTNHKDEALEILKEINRRYEQEDNVTHLDMGYMYHALGDEEKAIDFFEAAYNERMSGIVWINVDFKDDPIFLNDRFRKLLKKIGFEA